MSKRLYQRQLPVFLMSAIAAVITIEYFFGVQGLTDLKVELTQWGNIVAAFVLLFSQATLLMMHGQRLSERKASRSLISNSAIFFATWIIFAILIFSTPQQEGGELFRMVFIGIISLIDLGILAMKVGPHVLISMRLFWKITSIDAAAFFGSWIFSYFGEASSLVYIWPGFASIRDWIMAVPHASAMRGALLVAAIGSTVLGIRAIAGKEPGLVEMETV